MERLRRPGGGCSLGDDHIAHFHDRNRMRMQLRRQQPRAAPATTCVRCPARPAAVGLGPLRSSAAAGSVFSENSYKNILWEIPLKSRRTRSLGVISHEQATLRLFVLAWI